MLAGPQILDYDGEFDGSAYLASSAIPLANTNQEFDAMHTKWTLGLILTLVFFGAVRVHAQDDLLEDLYGRGVHAYNSHNYRNAWTLLNSVQYLFTGDVSATVK